MRQEDTGKACLPGHQLHSSLQPLQEVSYSEVFAYYWGKPERDPHRAAIFSIFGASVSKPHIELRFSLYMGRA